MGCLNEAGSSDRLATDGFASPANHSLPLAVGGCGKCQGNGQCGSHKHDVTSESHKHDEHEHEHAHQHAHDQDAAKSASLLDAPDHVLSTLEKDGSRRWLWPRLATGNHWKHRRWLGWALIAFFVTLPHLRVAGKPPLLIDIPARQLIVLGHTFLPTDTVLLALGMLSVFLSIMTVTTLAGRVWCGWGCPQTVYMEFLFRPIDRFFEGTSGHGGKPRRKPTGVMALARFGIYLILSMALAHTFLSYFVGTDRLAMWIRSSPVQHPAAFFVMIATTVAMLFDFLFFREQLCLIACPYGRFQSVMLDRRSMIVGYDTVRGEPRGKVQKQATTEAPRGDCVDCNLCVAVCPTGIDIRNGLQMECINCTQCIDACNGVMKKLGRPEGLIRYSSQDGLNGVSARKLRPRMLLYPTLLVGALSAFFLVLSTKSTFDASAVRGPGNPYTKIDVRQLQNTFKLRLVNRSSEDQQYTVTISQPAGATLEVLIPEALTMTPGQNRLIPISIIFPANVTATTGRVDAIITVRDSHGNQREVECQLLGPKQ